MIDNPISDASDDGAASTTPGLPTTVSIEDLQAFSIVVADLADAGVMGEAWARHDPAPAYNSEGAAYNDLMSSVDYVMTVSGNGQVSIPAEVRARWRADARVVAGKVRIVDLGDRVVVAPVFEDPVAALRGKYAGRGPRVDDARRRGRREDDEADSRKQTRGGSRQRTP